MRLCLGVIDRISWDDCYVLVLRSWINYGIYGVCIIVGIELGVVLVARMNWQEVWSAIWLNS